MQTNTNPASGLGLINIPKDLFLEEMTAYVKYLTDIDLTHHVFYEKNKYNGFKGHTCVVDGTQFDGPILIDSIEATTVILKDCERVEIGELRAKDVIVLACNKVLISDARVFSFMSFFLDELGIGEIHCDKMSGFMGNALIKAGHIVSAVIGAIAFRYQCEILDPTIFTREKATFGDFNYDPNELQFYFRMKPLIELGNWLFSYDKQEGLFLDKEKPSLRCAMMAEFIMAYTICGEFPIQWMMTPMFVPQFRSTLDKFNYLTKTTDAERKAYVDGIKIDDGFCDWCMDLFDSALDMADTAISKMGDLIAGDREIPEKEISYSQESDPGFAHLDVGLASTTQQIVSPIVMEAPAGQTGDSEEAIIVPVQDGTTTAQEEPIPPHVTQNVVVQEEATKAAPTTVNSATGGMNIIPLDTDESDPVGEFHAGMIPTIIGDPMEKPAGVTTPIRKKK